MPFGNGFSAEKRLRTGKSSRTGLNSRRRHRRGISPGELNIHHGPFLSVHGAIGEVTSHYRSLDYFYGSYVLSFRLVRPVKLEFFREGGKLKLKLCSYVRPWFRPFWWLGNKLLWAGFITLR
jgi:hypothetical protein